MIMPLLIPSKLKPNSRRKELHICTVIKINTKINHDMQNIHMMYLPSGEGGEVEESGRTDNFKTKVTMGII